MTCTASGFRHLQNLSSDKTKVHLSYHGLDLTRFPHFEGPRPLRDGSDPDDPVRILSVGRAVKKKGIDILLEALAALPSSLHWRFTHIGGGDELTGLKPLADELGLSDRIVWTGAMDQTQVLEHYRQADLFALACRITSDGDRDGLPNVLVEAASQKLTCISTNISGIPEFFIDGENGLLTAPEDATAFSRALQRVITDPGLRVKLGEAAENRVRTSFDHRNSITELKALFEQEWEKDL